MATLGMAVMAVMVVMEGALGYYMGGMVFETKQEPGWRMTLSLP